MQTAQIQDLLANEASAAVRAFTDRFGAALAGVDWEDITSSLASLDLLLREAGDAGLLWALYQRAMRDPELAAAAERFNLFSKIVLYSDRATGCKLRLHVFEEPVNEAHNHRAGFAALILRGGYVHALYGGDDAAQQVARGEIPKPLLVQRQLPGSSYAIHDAMVHSTLALEVTVSLMIQGPARRTEFNIINLDTGATRNRKGGGATAESQEQGERKLVEADWERVTGILEAAGVVDRDASRRRVGRKLVL